MCQPPESLAVTVTVQQKLGCVLWLAKLKSITHGQHDAQFQQDGVSPQYRNISGQVLNEHFPKKWTGKGSFLAQPSRSADLTPLEFFL
jgi:hypothetical protein